MLSGPESGPGQGQVLVAWAPTPNAGPLATRAALVLTGTHPGPLHHRCPTCGSIEHGRPSFDAPVEVSIAHAAGVSVVAVSTAGPVGVDIEAAGADLAWVTAEAIGKAHGVGITAPPPEEGARTAELTVPGYVAVLAVDAVVMPAIRMLPEAPGAPAGRART